jgi:hypothetical protein
MATAPQFYGPDNVLRSDFIFSTTSSFRFFSGVVDADTIDMQIAINGGDFSSDPDLIVFEGTSFTVPNPAAYPNGLQLFFGDNVIEVKSILSSGGSTSVGKATAILSTENEFGSVASPPTGVWVERQDRTVKVVISGLEDSNVMGYNVYATTAPAGGSVGWYRINPTLISTGESVEVLSDIADTEIDSDITVDENDVRLADPLYFNLLGTQTDADGVVVQTDFNEGFSISELVTRLRTSITVQAVSVETQFSFVHDRQGTLTSTNPTVPNPLFSTIAPTEPVFYAVTAIYLISDIEVESAFSPEVSGTPLLLTPQVGSLPVVSTTQIDGQIVEAIHRSQPLIAVHAGSVTRDTKIDPFVLEASRIRFILEFVHAASNFATLLAIDDPSGTGTSIPVNQSSYKQQLKAAFYLRSDAEVQALIDNSFDALAARTASSRESGKASRGEVTIYVTSRPSTSLSFFIGQEVSGGGQRFRLTSNAQINASGAGSNYNPVTGRWSTRAFIQAASSGVSGDVAPGVIRTITGAPAGVQVTNESRTFGGKGRETNRELATRAGNAIASVDVGTAQGIVRTAAAIGGVRQVNVIEAGHPLMLRDYLPEHDLHTGGKVDVWVRGGVEASVTDAFAFSFSLVKGMQFETFGDPSDLRFRAIDPNLSEENPIIEMLDFGDFGFQMRNESKDYAFDLTNVEVTSYNMIQLDGTLNDPADLDLEDLIRGSYRYRRSNKYIFTRQPVSSIVSFTGSRTGTVSSDLYSLFHTESPFQLGRSSEANDYIQVVQDPDGNISIPSSEPIVVEDEAHVILDGIEYVNNLGANPLSLRVFSNDRTVEYISPFVLSGTPDYTLVSGDETTPIGIQLTSDSEIVEGQSLLFDYEHDENFVVTYRTNALISAVQQDLDNNRHGSADVLAKAAIPVPVSLVLVVVLANSAYRQKSATQMKGAIRAEVSRLFDGLSQGEPLYPSDVVDVVKGLSGVSYLVLPFTKMTKSDGAVVSQEPLLVEQDSDYVHITSWSTSTTDVFFLVQELEASTTNGGGPEYEFRGVTQNKTVLTHFDTPPNANGVPFKYRAGAEYIIGASGMVVPGVTDESTLQAAYPFATATERADKREELSRNRVLLVLPKGEVPTDYEYHCYYVVDGDSGVKSIVPSPIEYLTLGDLEIVMDEEPDFAARIRGRA